MTIAINFFKKHPFYIKPNQTDNFNTMFTVVLFQKAINIK